MTVVEKAAYLKGLVEGLGIEPDSKEGKLWNCLNELLSDIAHEIEDLHETDMEHGDVLDDICEEMTYLEELCCPLDEIHDFDDDDEDDPYSYENVYGKELDEEDRRYSGLNGLIYDVTCPICGKEISFDEKYLELGSIECPICGEKLEFDLESKKKE